MPAKRKKHKRKNHFVRSNANADIKMSLLKYTIQSKFSSEQFPRTIFKRSNISEFKKLYPKMEKNEQGEEVPVFKSKAVIIQEEAKAQNAAIPELEIEESVKSDDSFPFFTPRKKDSFIGNILWTL